MDQEKFSALVGRLEGYAREQPDAYKFRVGALAALGYAYLFVVTVLLLALVVVVVYYLKLNWLVIKILWIPLVLVGVVLRSLWVKFPEPDGRRLERAEAPALFELVKEVESAVEAPHAHHILLTDDFNAAVVQVPRLGVFGWQKNYLLLGLPLMQALPPEQFRAVLAHELGHLSGNHGRFGGWIYRVRQTWVQILLRLEQEQRYGSFIFERFVNWYAPFFNAYSFVLARKQEYEADASAAQLAGKEHTARSLVNMEIKGRFLAEDFWPGFYKQADERPEPPPDVFAQFVAAVRHRVPTETAQKWFVQALAVPTGHVDTHPALADRLAALGYAAPPAGDGGHLRLLPPDESDAVTAAQHYLGPLVESYLTGRNRWWQELVGQSWRERHREVQQALKTVERLTEKARSHTLLVAERWELTCAVADTQGAEAALPHIRAVLDTHPDHAEANYAYGRILLEQKDEAGVAYVERAMAAKQDAILPGCQAIYVFFKEQGRDEEAEPYRARAEQHYRNASAAAARQ